MISVQEATTASETTHWTSNDTQRLSTTRETECFDNEQPDALDCAHQENFKW
jgi:hypothetical protein